MLPERLDGLVIEITENELVVGDPAIREALAALRARGARLAVDDTGAGYAGLTHVMRLQPDIIKLDRALTTGVDLDPAKAPLISSFVRYARDIDADVCAEGVETLAELERLADLDVAYGQGYGIARPSAPWISVNPEPAAASRASFRAAFADDHTSSDLEELMRRLALGEDGSLEAMAGVLGADEVLLLPGPAPRQPGARLRSGRGGRGAARGRLRRQARAADRHARAARGLQPPRAPVDALPARPRPHPRAPARGEPGARLRRHFRAALSETFRRSPDTSASRGSAAGRGIERLGDAELRHGVRAGATPNSKTLVRIGLVLGRAPTARRRLARRYRELPAHGFDRIDATRSRAVKDHELATVHGSRGRRLARHGSSGTAADLGG